MMKIQKLVAVVGSQSTRMRFPAAATRYFEPVTVPAPPRNVISIALSPGLA